MDIPSSERIYDFDESFISLFKVKFLQRRSPTLPLEIVRVKLITFAAAALLLYTLCFSMKIVKYIQGFDMEFAEAIEVVALISAFVISFCRGTTLLIHQKEMRRMLWNLEKLFPITSRDQLKYHLPSYAMTIILRNKTLRALTSVGSVVYFLKPILKSLFDWIFTGQQYVCRYPFISWHPLDENRLIFYPLLYFAQMFTSLTAGFFILNDDFIFTTSVTYLCMHYHYLNSLLSQLDATNESESLQQVKKLIRYQYALENVRDDIDKIFSLSTFIGFTIMKASLCLFMFSVFNGIDIMNMIPFTITSMVFLIPTYVRCFNGTELQKTTESLINSMYNHNWYEGKPKYRKMITIMMTRANRPLLLHATRVNIISLEYFKEFLIQTYQIFMFLANFSK